MSRRIGWTRRLIVSGLALSLAAPAAFAGNPPSGAMRIIGPSAEGVFVASFDVSAGQLVGTFVGSCKDNRNRKVPISVFIEEPTIDTLKAFEALTEASLMHYTEGLRGAAPPGCFPPPEGTTDPQDLIVTGVQKFVVWESPDQGRFPSTLGAELQLSVIELK